jgi:transcription-repair coupling factor (superfamily II helicase)
MLLAVLTASANDAQRLLDEIPWFAPELRVRLLPDWETLPYDSFSPHHDLVSERLATLYSVTRGECDVLLVPADGSLPLRAAGLSGGLHLLSSSRARSSTPTVPRPADAGRLCARDARCGARRILDPRRPGRPLPDGLATALPPRPLRRRNREHQDLRRRHAAHALSGAGNPPAAGARVSRSTTRGARIFPPALSAKCFEGDPARRDLQGRLERHSRRPASNTGCRCSSRKRRRCSTTCPEHACSACTTTCPKRSAILARRAVALRHALRRAQPAAAAAGRTLPGRRTFFIAAKPYARLVLTKAATARRAALPPLAVDRRADDPLPAESLSSTAFPGRVLLLAERPGAAKRWPACSSRIRPEARRQRDLRPAFLASDSQARARRRAPCTTASCSMDRRLHHRNRALRRQPVARTRHAAQRKASLDNWLRDLTELKVGDRWCTSSTASAATGPDPHGPRRRRHGVPRTALRQRRQALRAGVAAARHLALLAAPTRTPRRCTRSARSSGKRPSAGRPAGARHRRRTARLYAQRAARQGHAFEFKPRTTTTPSPTASASRKPPTRPPPSTP